MRIQILILRFKGLKVLLLPCALSAQIVLSYGIITYSTWRRVLLTPGTLDLEVQGSTLARRLVSLVKKIHSPLSLSTQVYKWVPVTYCGEERGEAVTLQWTSIPSREE